MIQNNEKFIINRLCEFKDRETECDFMKYEKKVTLKTVRILVLLMGIVFTLFIISDYSLYKENNAYLIALFLRMIALFISVVVFSLVGKIKNYDRALAMVSLSQLMVFTLYLMKLYMLPGSDKDLQFMTVVLFILTVFLIPNKWKNCLITGCIILVSFLLFSAVSTYKGALLLLARQEFYLGITLVTCAIFLHGRVESQRKQYVAEKLLELMSITDRLTGIYNRGRFEHAVEAWMKNMRHNPFCLLLFDIDDFKKVNDRFGHAVGDQVLVEISEAVSANIRDEDIFARWGGEEFVILFGSTGVQKAAELAERLRKVVESKPCTGAGRVTISIGIAVYHQGETLTDLVDRADSKMYEAKKAGKNQVIAESVTP